MRRKHQRRHLRRYRDRSKGRFIAGRIRKVYIMERPVKGFPNRPFLEEFATRQEAIIAKNRLRLFGIRAKVFKGYRHAMFYEYSRRKEVE